MSLVTLAGLAVACSGSPRAQLVSATIATNGCATLTGVNSRLAQEAMQKLVDGCTSVPGGSTKFTVTLLPGGRIELPQGPDQPETIPTCVLKNDLRHRVQLPKACSLVVRLEETSVSVPSVDAALRDTH
jgi:hypothetical protein